MQRSPTPPFIFDNTMIDAGLSPFTTWVLEGVMPRSLRGLSSECFFESGHAGREGGSSPMTMSCHLPFRAGRAAQAIVQLKNEALQSAWNNGLGF